MSSKSYDVSGLHYYCLKLTCIGRFRTHPCLHALCVYSNSLRLLSSTIQFGLQSDSSNVCLISTVHWSPGRIQLPRRRLVTGDPPQQMLLRTLPRGHLHHIPSRHRMGPRCQPNPHRPSPNLRPLLLQTKQTNPPLKPHRPNPNLSRPLQFRAHNSLSGYPTGEKVGPVCSDRVGEHAEYRRGGAVICGERGRQFGPGWR